MAPPVGRGLTKKKLKIQIIVDPDYIEEEDNDIEF